MSIAYLRFVIAYFKTLLILLFCFPLIANAQKLDLNISYTNGDYSLWPHIMNDSVVLFIDAGIHDMGFAFCLNLKKTDRISFYVNGDSCYENTLYDRIEPKSINGKQVLLLKNKGELVGFYRQEYANEGLYDLFTDIKINHELAGKYINPVNGKVVVFNPGKRKASGLAKTNDYDFEEESDIPTEFITFNKKQTFYYDVTEKGLDIFSVKRNDDSWESGKKIMSLVKVGWLNADSLNGVSGKFPFASKEFLIDGILSCYSTTKLALMRNEIYARHGLIFKSETLKKYFSSQSWYKPQFEKVDNQLSELEKLNIELIKRYEIIQKENERMWKEAHQN